uniref:Uncharacterized protein n=1 Tax=Globodera rostochiensis TaxID=31243 RepID=A0A914GSE5_GLORO
MSSVLLPSSEGMKTERMDERTGWSNGMSVFSWACELGIARKHGGNRAGAPIPEYGSPSPKTSLPSETSATVQNLPNPSIVAHKWRFAAAEIGGHERICHLPPPTTTPTESIAKETSLNLNWTNQHP